MQSSNLSDHYHSEAQDPDLLECCKCCQQVEQILALQCDHNLCLDCAAGIVKTWPESAFPPLQCDICQVNTMVDPSAITILREIAKSQQWQNSASRDSRESRHSRDQSLEKEVDNLAYQSQYMENPLAYVQASYDHVEPKHYETGSSFKQTTKYTAQSQIPQPQQQTNQVTCSSHQGEQAVLYCYTCESQCFCMECYLAGMHKNHDVKSVQKSFAHFRNSRVDTLCQRLKLAQDSLLSDQCGLNNKKAELAETVNQAKQQVKQNFHELHVLIERKEHELLQAADEMVCDKLQEFDEEMERLKNHFDTLDQFHSQLQHLFVSPDSAVEGFNYVSKNKKKIENLIESLTQVKQSVEQSVQIQYTFDPSTVIRQLDEIKAVRLQVSALRGIETNNPTSRERYFFEKAKEERSKRLFQNIITDKLQPFVTHDQNQNLNSDQTQQSMRSDRNKFFEDEAKENSVSFIKQTKKQQDFFDFEKKFNEAKKLIMRR